ncbi:MAG: MFS transporter [Chloroflexi bacterium]|jgi:fucose permease|nr:MFS transporter [Anaerolineaceae bacterium]NMB88092.1 MFS transporter [Chloroflexota bacterium]
MEHSRARAAQSKIGLIVLAYVAFIALGLPDGLMGVAWPSIQSNFGLPLDALGLLFITSTAGYLVSSFLSGQFIARLGIGGVLAASCALTGLSLTGYTLAPGWGTIVALGVFSGFGAGAIDAGLNTYVAANFEAGLMQWLHASYGIGVTLGPMIMTASLNLYDSWRLGYRVVSFAQLALAGCFFLTLSLWQRGGDASPDPQAGRITDYRTPLGQTLHQPAVWLSLALFFLYTGAEITLGAWAYTLLTQSRAIPSQTAGLVAGSYWAMFTIGRVLAGLYTRRIPGHTLLRVCILAALLGVGLLWWNPSDFASLLGVAITGFAIAPIYPGLVSGTPERVGDAHAANTIGMQVAVAGLSAAILPGLAGVIARRVSLEALPPYLFALFALLLATYFVAMRRPVRP